MASFLMGNRLRDLISSIRACKTAAEERAVVTKECAALRDLLTEPIQYHRHRNIAKLMFIHMLGYPTHFGQMECIKVIAESDYPEKRIGYLGLMVLLDERQEVLMLVTNSIKNDLHHSNQHVTGLALCALGNICTAEMARDLTSEVQRLLNDNNAYIRKKAALCAVRLIRKVPDLIDSYKGPASNLLLDKHHGVLVSGVKLCIELCRASDTALEHFRKQVETIVRLLKNLVLGGYVPEYDVSGISDPLLQMKLLKLLRLVGKGDSDSSDIMSDVLAQVATNTEGAKNAGKAILYECVLTIMAIEDIGGLRVLAINILGRFLPSMDNNVRYVALNTLAKVVVVDNQAVQRHRKIIVNCIKDSDVSIRARALELVIGLVNEKNVKALTTELLEYLKVSDPEFKVDLVAKIAALVYKYAPTKLWYIDQLILIMVEAGKYVKEDVVRSLVAAVSNAPDLQGYAVRALHSAFRKWSGQESLAQVTVWCIGEYGDMLVNNWNELEDEEPQTVTESDAVDVVESVLHDYRVGPVTIAFSLTALLKLTSRFPQCSQRIKALLDGHSRSIILELQQRSTEFGSIISRHSNLRGPLLERMPALDMESYYTKHAGKYECRSVSRSVSPVDRKLASVPAPTEVTMNSLIDMLSFQPEEHLSAPAVAAGVALQHILGVPSPTPATSTLSSTPVRYSMGGATSLLDILSLGEETNPQISTASQEPSTLNSLLSNPKPDHRLSILELNAQPLRATPAELRTNSVPHVEPTHQISSFPFVDIPLTDSRSSTFQQPRHMRISTNDAQKQESQTQQQPTVAERKRISMTDAQKQESLTQTQQQQTLAERKRISMLDAQKQESPTQQPTLAEQKRRVSMNDAQKQESVTQQQQQPTLAEQKRISISDAQKQESLTQQRRKSLFDDVLKNSEVKVAETWPTTAQQRKLKEESEARLSRLSFLTEPQLSPKLSSESSGTSKSSDDSTWPSRPEQQKLKEDSTVRISRMSHHSQSSEPAAADDVAWPSQTQQQNLKDDSAMRISGLSHHTPAPYDNAWPSPSLKEDRPSRLSYQEPEAAPVLPSPAEQLKLKEEAEVRISRMASPTIEPPILFEPCDDYPSIVALQTQGLRVDFGFTKRHESPQSTVIKASFTNLSTTPYTDFVFQAAVPKYMTLKMYPASGSSLPDKSVGAITQLLMATNSMHGQKPFIMRLRISYKMKGRVVLEQGQVNHFPPNL